MSNKIFTINDFSLKTDQDSFCWSTSAINIADQADFVNMAIGDKFKLIVGTNTWELMITQKDINRTNINRPETVITAASPSYELNFEKITKDYSSIHAQDAVEDILGYPVSEWGIANWLIPKMSLAFDKSKKIDAIRSITNAVKAVIQTRRDNSLIISKRYPIPPAYWENVPSYQLDSDSHELSYSEQFDRIETYNFVSVGSDDDLQCEMETDIDDNGFGYINLYPIPWRPMGLLHTSTNSVKIGIPTEEQRINYCEIVTFQNGQASVTKPIYQLLSVDWQHDQLVLEPISSDDKTIFATGGKFEEGYSVAKLNYKYRYIRYPVTIPKDKTVQFLATELL